MSYISISMMIFFPPYAPSPLALTAAAAKAVAAIEITKISY
jgi:hypothetical protein